MSFDGDTDAGGAVALFRDGESVALWRDLPRAGNFGRMGADRNPS